MRDLDMTFWCDLAKILPPHPTIIDLGAHGLEEAQALLPLLSDAIWHAVEADPVLASACHNHVRAVWGNKHEVKIYNLAITANPSTSHVTLHRSRKRDGSPWTASSSIKKPSGALTAYPWMTFPEDVEVPATSLDVFAAHHAKIDGQIALLKMDVQGAEIDVIRGGLETLAKTKLVLTEVVEYPEYAGQACLPELMDTLPGKWIVRERLQCDALLENVT